MKHADILRSATSRLERAVATRDKVAAAIAAIAVRGKATGQDIGDLRRAYETAAADVALGSATQDQVDIARQNLEVALQRRKVADREGETEAVLRAGLERKLSAADAELVQASEQARLAEVDYLRSELNAADKIYVTAALEVEAAIQRITACRLALGERKADGFAVQHFNTTLPVLSVQGPASEAHVRAVFDLGSNGSLHGRGLFAPLNLSVLSDAIKAELAEAAQDHGLIGRVRKAIAGAID